MPPTFPYLVFLAIWVFGAALVWIAAVLMLVTKRTRALFKPICFAMAATFPAVFAYQLFATPVIAISLVGTGLVCLLLEPGGSGDMQNPFAIAVCITFGFSSIAIVAAMSLTGFYEGWRIGWALAKGRTFRQVLCEGPTAKLLARLPLKRAPSPF